MEGRTLTLFILSPHPLPLPSPHRLNPALTLLLSPHPLLSKTVEDSFNAPDNLCGRLRTMEIK